MTAGLLQVVLCVAALTLLALFYRSFRTAVQDNRERGGGAGAWSAGISLGAIFFYLPGLFILGVTGEFKKPVFKDVPDLVDVSLTDHFAAVAMFIALVASVYIGARASSRLRQARVTQSHVCSNAKFFFWVAVAYVGLLSWDTISNGLLSGQAHWYQTRHDAMSVEHGSLANVLLLYLKNAARLLFFATLFSLWRIKKLSHFGFVSVLLLTLAIDVYLSGNRFIIAACSFLYLFYLTADRNWRHIAVLACAGAPIALFATVFMRARGRLHGRDTSQSIWSFFQEIARESPTGAVEYFSNAFEGINFNTFVAVFNDAPEQLAFLFGQTFLKPFVFWIPRGVWENKILRAGQILGEHYTGSSDLSIVATLPGEAWLNFGYLSVLVVPLLVIIAVRIFSAMARSLPREVAFSIVFFFCFSLCRASYAALMIDAVVMTLLVSTLIFVVYGRVEVWGRKITVKPPRVAGADCA